MALRLIGAAYSQLNITSIVTSQKWCDKNLFEGRPAGDDGEGLRSEFGLGYDKKEKKERLNIFVFSS